MVFEPNSKFHSPQKRVCTKNTGDFPQMPGYPGILVTLQVLPFASTGTILFTRCNGIICRPQIRRPLHLILPRRPFSCLGIFRQTCSCLGHCIWPSTGGALSSHQVLGTVEIGNGCSIIQWLELGTFLYEKNYPQKVFTPTFSASSLALPFPGKDQSSPVQQLVSISHHVKVGNKLYSHQIVPLPSGTLES